MRPNAQASLFFVADSHLVAHDSGVSNVWLDDAGEHPYCSGLTGIIGSEETEDFSPFYFKADVVNGKKAVVELARADTSTARHCP